MIAQTFADVARERDILAKAYNIVGALIGMEPDGHFGANVARAEQSQVFHDMIERVAEMGITPATFIAVHALAQCAESIRDLPPDGQAKGLHDYLFDTVSQSLGPEIHGHLREWISGTVMDDSQLERATTWAKLGAMSKSLQFVDVFAVPPGAEMTAQHAAVLTGIVEMQGRIADACKDLGPGLHGYYAGKLEQAAQAIGKPPQRGPQGPGFTVS
jgi:hypothetical protein